MKAKIKDAEHLKHFFDGTEDYEQVENVTVGKTYEIIKVENYGDVDDYTFIDDKGEEQTLCDFFFE